MSGVAGKRIKCRYLDENLYVSVFPPKQEIFVSMVEHDPDKQNALMANLDAISRLSSRLWQGNGLVEVLKQLNRASRVKSDFPGLLATILEDNGG